MNGSRQQRRGQRTLVRPKTSKSKTLKKVSKNAPKPSPHTTPIATIKTTTNSTNSPPTSISFSPQLPQQQIPPKQSFTQHPSTLITNQNAPFGVRRKGSGGGGSSRKGGGGQYFSIDQLSSMFEGPGGGGGKGKGKRNSHKSHQHFDSPFEMMDMFPGSGYDSPSFKRMQGGKGRGNKVQMYQHEYEDPLEAMFREGFFGDDDRDHVFGDVYGLDDSSDMDVRSHGRRSKKGNRQHMEVEFMDIDSDDYPSRQARSARNTKSSRRSQKYDDDDDDSGQELDEDEMKQMLFGMFGGNPENFGFEDVSAERQEKRQRRKEERAVNSKRIMRTLDGVEIFGDDNKVQEAMSSATIREAEVIDINTSNDNNNDINAKFASASQYTAKFTNKMGKGAPAKNPNADIGGRMHEAQFESVADIEFRQLKDNEMRQKFEEGNKRGTEEYEMRMRKLAKENGDNNNNNQASQYVDEYGNPIDVEVDEMNRIVRRRAVEVTGAEITKDKFGRNTFTSINDESTIYEYSGPADQQLEQMRKRIEQSNYEFQQKEAERIKKEALDEAHRNPNAHQVIDKLDDLGIDRSKLFTTAGTTPSKLLNTMLGDIAEKGAQKQREKEAEERSQKISSDDIRSIKMVQARTALSSTETKGSSGKTDMGMNQRYKYTGSNAVDVDNKNAQVEILDDELNQKMNKMNNAYDNVSTTLHRLTNEMNQHIDLTEKMKARGQNTDRMNFDVKKTLQGIKRDMRVETAQTPQERTVLKEFPNLSKHAYGMNTALEDEIEEHRNKHNVGAKTAEDIVKYLRDQIFNHRTSPTFLLNSISEQYGKVKQELKMARASDALTEHEYVVERAQLEDLMNQKNHLVALFIAQRDGLPKPKRPTVPENDTQVKSSSQQQQQQQQQQTQPPTKQSETVTNTTTQSTQATSPSSAATTTTTNRAAKRPTLEELLRKNKEMKDVEQEREQAEEKAYFQKNGAYFHDERIERSQRQRDRSQRGHKEWKAQYDLYKSMLGPDDEQQNNKKNKPAEPFDFDLNPLENMASQLYDEMNEAQSHRPSERSRKDHNQRLREEYRPSRRFSTLNHNHISGYRKNTLPQIGLFSSQRSLLHTKLQSSLSFKHSSSNPSLALQHIDPITQNYSYSTSPVAANMNITTSTQRFFSNDAKKGSRRTDDLVDKTQLDDSNIRLDSLLASASHRKKQLAATPDQPLKPTASRKMQQFKKQEEDMIKHQEKIKQAKNSALKTSMKNLGDSSHTSGFVKKQLGKINSTNELSKMPDEYYHAPTKQGRKALREARLKDMGRGTEKRKPKGSALPPHINKAIHDSVIRNVDGTGTTFQITANGNVLRKKKQLTGIQRARAAADALKMRSRDYVGNLTGRYPTTFEEATTISPNTSRPKLPVWMADMDNDPYMLNQHWSDDGGEFGADDEEADEKEKEKIKKIRKLASLNGESDDDYSSSEELGLADERTKADRAFSHSRREQDKLLATALSLEIDPEDDQQLDELSPLHFFDTDPLTLIKSGKIDMIPEEDETRFEVMVAKGLMREKVEKELKLKGASNLLDIELEDDSIPVSKSTGTKKTFNDDKTKNQDSHFGQDDVDAMLKDTDDIDADGETAGESDIERALNQLLLKSSTLGVDTIDSMTKANDETTKKENMKKKSQHNDISEGNNNDGDEEVDDTPKRPRTQRELINQIADERFAEAFQTYQGKLRRSGIGTYDAQLDKFEEELEQQRIEAKLEAGLEYITELEDDSDFIDDEEADRRQRKQKKKMGGSDDDDDDDDSDDIADTNNIYLPRKYMDLHKKGLYTQKSARRKNKDQLLEEMRTQAEWNRDTDEFYQQTELLQMKGFALDDQETEQQLQRRLDRYKDISRKFSAGQAPETPLLNQKLRQASQYQDVETDQYDDRFDHIEDDLLSDYDENALLDDLINDNDDDNQLNISNLDLYDEVGFLKPEYQHLEARLRQNEENQRHGHHRVPINDDGVTLTPRTTFTTQKNRKDKQNIIDLEDIIENEFDDDDVEFQDAEEQSYVKGYDAANRASHENRPQAVAKIVGGERFYTFELHEDDLEEHFVRGSGPGGQSVNKTKNCVVLQHVPTSTIVKCSQTRELHRNRAIARKIMRRKLEALFKGKDSYLGRKVERLQKKKQKAARRQKSSEKYASKRDEEIERLRAKLGLTQPTLDDNADDGNVEIVQRALTQELNPNTGNKNTKM